VRLFALVPLATAALVGPGGAGASALPATPPLAISSNVELLANVPTGPAFGMNFKDHFAFLTGPTGLTVLDIAVPAAPTIVATFRLRTSRTRTSTFAGTRSRSATTASTATSARSCTCSTSRTRSRHSCGRRPRSD
jgi:hypothetical protein